MTDADRMVALLIEWGPMPSCHLATSLRKRRADVDRELRAHPRRFVHNGQKARASRWGVIGDVVPTTVDERIGSIDTDELAARWEALLELSAYTATSFVNGFVERGVLERIDGNGRVRVTELGRELMGALMTGAGDERVPA